MVMVIVFPDNVIFPCVELHDGTRVDVGEGVKEGVRVKVTVGESVADGVILGVLETSGVRDAVSVGVSEAVLVGVTGSVGVLVGVEGVYVEGGAVTTIATLTRMVRALCALMGLLFASERSRKPTIRGTIGR